MEERVGEPLARLVACYEGGRIRPLEFRWGTRDFRVQSVHARWRDRSTCPGRRFFCVTADSGEVFQISHREGDPVWYVDAVILP